MSVVSGYMSSEATRDAAEIASDTSNEQYYQTREDYMPFYNWGMEGLEMDAGEMPSYEETVYDPMQEWDYKSSEGYQAQLQQDLGVLANQQNARGLASSGVAASQAAEVATDLTAQDYANEYNREYGELSDLYSGKLSEYSQRYDEIMNRLKVGTGATDSITSAGQSNTENQIDAATASGEADSSYWSGVGGLTTTVAANSLANYDYGNKGSSYQSSGEGEWV